MTENLQNIKIGAIVIFKLDLQILSVLFYLIILWLLGVSFFLYKTVSHYNHLVKGEDKKNLKELLDEILKAVGSFKKEIEDLETKTLKLEKDSLLHIQKIGLLKFNPFKDIGGEQSFILSLLDKEDNGVVITSLHGRETTRWYVKKVKRGKGVNYQLSKEEVEAIKKNR